MTTIAKVLSFGNPNNPDCHGWLEKNVYVSTNDLPEGIKYFSVNQTIEYKLGKSKDGKPRAIDIEIVGPYYQTGQVKFCSDEYCIVNDKCGDFYYLKNDENNYNIGDYITYLTEDMDEISLTDEEFKDFNSGSDQLKLNKIVVDIQKSIFEQKPTKKGKINFWDNKRKFGFISEEGTDASIYINKLPDGLTELKKFTKVEFTKHKNAKGFYSKNVKIIDSDEESKECETTPTKEDELEVGGCAAEIKPVEIKPAENILSKVNGMCSNWNSEKKCGTIDINGSKHYVHNTDIIMEGFRKLEIGNKVSCYLYTNGAGNTKAINVKII